MKPIDYVKNALLRRDSILKFVPPDQCDYITDALKILEQDGNIVFRINMKNIGDSSELLRKFSEVIVAPWEIENWGMFEDAMAKLCFLVPHGRTCFFCMENAAEFWKNNTLIAGTLSNEIQSAYFHWSKQEKFLYSIYYIC